MSFPDNKVSALADIVHTGLSWQSSFEKVKADTNIVGIRFIIGVNDSFCS